MGAKGFEPLEPEGNRVTAGPSSPTLAHSLSVSCRNRPDDLLGFDQALCQLS